MNLSKANDFTRKPKDWEDEMLQGQEIILAEDSRVRNPEAVMA